MKLAMIEDALAAIEANPRRVDLSIGYIVDGDHHDKIDSNLGLIDQRHNSGGLAAWICFVAGDRPDHYVGEIGEDLEVAAARIAELSPSQASALFGMDRPNGGAKEAAQRLRLLIRSVPYSAVI